MELINNNQTEKVYKNNQNILCCTNYNNTVLSENPNDKLNNAKIDLFKSEKKKWTVLVYADGANDLKPYINHDVNRLLKDRAKENTNIIIRHAELDKKFNRKTTDYFITKNSLGSKDISEISMGDGREFSKFLTDNIKKYPADHYMIVLQDHGMGFRGVCTDDKYNDILTLTELKTSFENAKRSNNDKTIDIVLFNACQMQQAEVASQLKDSVNVILGSEEVGMNYGRSVFNINFPQKKYIDELENYDDPKQFAKDVVSDSSLKARMTYRTFSAVDTEKISQLEEKLKSFSNSVINLDKIKDKEAVERIRNCVKGSHHYYPGEGEIDLIDLMNKITDDDFLRKNYPKINKNAHLVKSKAIQSILAERHKKTGWNTPREQNPESVPYLMLSSDKGSFGLGIYMPLKKKWIKDPYEDAEVFEVPFSIREIDFIKSTRWNEMIKTLAE